MTRAPVQSKQVGLARSFAAAYVSGACHRAGNRYARESTRNERRYHLHHPVLSLLL